MWNEPIDLYGLDWFGQQLASEMEAYAAEDAALLPSTNESLLRSILHKALRRKDRKFALSAGLSLLHCHTSALWRSLVTIALQDFGLADLSLTATIVAAAADEKLRKACGGDHRVLLFLLDKLLAANCDRVLDSAQRIARGNCWRLMNANSEEDLPKDEVSVFIEEICHIAIRSDGGFGSVVAAQCDAIFQRLIVEGLASATMVEMCHYARRISRSLAPVLLPYVRDASAQIAADEALIERPVSPTHIIGGLPSYALDGNTPVGRSVLEEALATNREVKMLVWDVAPELEVSVIASLLFLVEGSLCARENSDCFSRALQRIAEQYFSPLPLYRMAGAMEVMQQIMPMIEFLRRSHWEKMQRKSRRKATARQVAGR